MKELHFKQSAPNLKSEILNILQFYNIGLHQIYSITSDNGANMLKTIKLLQDELYNNENDEDENEALVTEKDLLEMETLIVKERAEPCVINTIRCAAHTLQLVVTDVLKSVENKKIIEISTQITLALKKSENRHKLFERGLKSPILKNSTRWCSTFYMIERLLELKNFIITEKVYDLDLETWIAMENFIEVFQHIKEATIKLQYEQIYFCNLFKLWLELQFKITKINSAIAKEVLCAMSTREKLLFENETLVASIYLDPRFKYTLSDEQIKRATAHLKNLSDHISKYILAANNAILNNETSAVLPSSSTSSVDSDEFDIFLQNIKPSSSIGVAATTYNEIDNYKDIARISYQCEIIDYWNQKSFEFPHLFILFKVLNGVPASQVSVERCFSALSHILSKYRTRLSETTLENILLIKVNQKFSK